MRKTCQKHNKLFEESEGCADCKKQIPTAYADVIRQAAVTMSFISQYKTEKERINKQAAWEDHLREEVKKQGYRIMESFREE